MSNLKDVSLAIGTPGFLVHLDKNNADPNSQDRLAHRLQEADQDLETEFLRDAPI
jgi:hypothetical protein